MRVSFYTYSSPLSLYPPTTSTKSAMGAFISNLLAGGPADAAESDSSEAPLVLKFHSSARWQLHFNSVKDTSQLVVIDFTATWCGPCKAMAPVFQTMAEKFTGVQFVKIDVDELSEVAREFGVQAMPTFVLVKKGKEVDRVVGAKKDELERKVLKHSAT